MAPHDDLDRWIADLRRRLARGELAGLGPFDLGDGTGDIPGERTVRVMLADLDHLDALPSHAEEWRDFPARRRDLRDDFRRLRAVLG
jgi:hypothetical protein